MINTATQPIFTPEEYLANEASASVKHEYVNGEVFAMAGAGERHNRIAGNAFFLIRSQTRGTPCGAFIADMKLYVEKQNAFYYPDALLTCDPGDDHPLYKTAPCLVVEVLSPSTANIDRREKRMAYQTLDSLRAYLLVDAEQRQVDYYLRGETGEWLKGRLEENETLSVECGKLEVPFSLDLLYEDVTWG